MGNALKQVMPEWKSDILIEKTKTLREAPGKHPDVLLVHHSIPPVAIESSVKKGDADLDAKSRLGMRYVGNGREIQTAIAVELSEDDINTSRLSTQDMIWYALHQPGHRFPKNGFMRGTVRDLAKLAATSAVTKEKMEETATLVAGNVTAAANILEIAIKQQDLLEISHTLYQRSALTGLRTTMVLWLNAFLVQQRLRGSIYDIPRMTHTPSKCLEAWRAIHDINWRAIFGPAIDILDHTRTIAVAEVSEALKLLMDAAEHIEMAKLVSDINIGAELFPKIAEDRKQSAAFYTQPATAEMLAALTITQGMADWSDADVFKQFRIADMACGTGTLLRFGYRQVKAYHMATEYTDESIHALHRNAMEYGLVGTDVSPIAAHLTSTSLAVDAKQRYGNTNIGWVGVGNENRTGAIEYVATDIIQDLMMVMVGRSTGQGGHAGYGSVPIKDHSIDVILMNPPYSRTRGGQSAFDIANLSDRERDACQKRWGTLIRNEPCKKTAGMAATFLCIARKKVKPGGRIGFVLPRTAAFADSWEQTRAMIETDFEDIVVVAVSSGKALGQKALSADTKMEEMLLVATRKERINRNHSQVKCVTLYEPVTRLGEAAVIAEAIRGTDTGPVIVGREVGVAKMFRTVGGRPWSYVGAVHEDIATIADLLSLGVLQDLEGNEISCIPMTTIGALFTVGPTHDRIGHPVGGDDRGAFTFHQVISETDTIGRYRSLWGANSKTQTCLVVTPTHKGTPYTAKADIIWDTRSTLFYARGMRWTSQSVVAATTRHKVMGGRAWTGLWHDDVRIQKAFALWANSIYGMMIHWTRGSRTQSGRASLQVKAISKVPCPDFAQFDDTILDEAAAKFDRLHDSDMLPARMATQDKTRAAINSVVSHMINAPNYDTDTLTKIWCAEPSVRSSK